VRAGIEEIPQPLRGLRDRVRPRNADNVKALRAGKSGEFGLERRRTQKSRLA
jgi:hypothetical protein